MSTLVTSNISDGTTSVGTGYVVNGSAKAWVNFDQVSTNTARDSLNASSMTDFSTGQAHINMTSAFTNTNYAVALGVGVTDNYIYQQEQSGNKTASKTDVRTTNQSHAYVDANWSAWNIGDLA